MNAFFFRQPKFPTLFPEKATQYDKKNFLHVQPCKYFLEEIPRKT